MSSLTILTVSIDYPPQAGGIAAHVYELCQAMAAAGHHIHILTKAKSTDHQQNNITLHTLPKRIIGPLYGRTINRHVEKKARQIRPDIIHIHGMRPLEFLTPKDLPVVYTNHTSGYLKRIKKGGYRIAKLKRLFATPDLFLAPSEELLDIPFPIKAAKIFIPNGVVVERFNHNREDRARIRAELGYTTRDIVGIVTRRLVEKNGVIFLAQAMRQLNNPHFKLLLIGDGPEAPAIQAELAAHFSGRFQMLGSKTHGEIVPFYSAADLSILPSLMEATSISCLEAMAASLPIVATDVGGLPVLVRPSENGVLCSPQNPSAIAKSIDEITSADLKSMGMQSRRIVETEFSWDHIARQTIDAYRGVM